MPRRRPAHDWDELPALRVPPGWRARLAGIAETEGIGVVDARRQALSDWMKARGRREDTRMAKAERYHVVISADALIDSEADLTEVADSIAVAAGGVLGRTTWHENGIDYLMEMDVESAAAPHCEQMLKADDRVLSYRSEDI
jgi:hypothetical protein